MKKTHLLLMLALCATLLASCSAGEPDVTQTQPVPSISPTNTPDENTVWTMTSFCPTAEGMIPRPAKPPA